MKKAIALLLILSTIMMLSGCASMSNTAKGTAIGATAGGVLGGIIGNKAGNTAAGAIIGAAIGGAAGAIIGNYMDKQAAEIERDIEGARVERVGEGIKITFDSGILFAVDRAVLQDQAKANLTDLAKILNKYDDTVILIEGHTDATGSEEYNLDLSKKRAQAVANQLSTNGVLASRFTLMGYGESQPVASNETAEGRQENRRVEVAIMANDKLKKAAKEQAAG